MKAISNVHVHSSWCDGESTTRDITEKAISLGFTDLGFSSHAPTPFDKECPGIVNEDEYVNDISKLKQEYAGKFNILCGIEQDCYALGDRSKYDYSILSAHYFPKIDESYNSVDSSQKETVHTLQNRYSSNGISMAKDYYSLLMEKAKDIKPDIVGHFDLITKFNRNNELFDENSKEYMNMSLSFLKEIVECINSYGGMIEINTSRMRYREDGYPYAGSPYILKYLCESCAKVIITTDSHSKATLDYMYSDTVELLKSNGFTSMAILKNGKFIDIQI